MKGSHSTVLLQSRSMVPSKRVYSRKNVWQKFFPGTRAITHSYESGEKSFSWGFCQEAVQNFLNIWSGEFENFSTITVEYFDFFHPVGWKKLDHTFHPGTPSCTPQITKCGGQLIRTVYVFSLAAGGSSVQSLIQVQLFETSWSAAHHASLSFTTSRSLLKPMLAELVMPSNYLILCHLLLLLPSIFPSIMIFSNESALHIRQSK